MKKPHLFTTEEPWRLWDIQLQADCGREVAQAQCMAMVDTYGDVWLSGKNLCQKCKEAHKTARYLYVIMEGQAALDEAQSA